MSSPRAGALMLNTRAGAARRDTEEASTENPHYERLETADDELPGAVLDAIAWTAEERSAFTGFADRLLGMQGTEADVKIASCLLQVQKWHKAGYSPIVFCRYIETAKYVAERIAEKLGAGVLVECVTSEDPDDIRRARIQAMAPERTGNKRRLLVATDCLSEGINLQSLFDAVLHYDLPWNPNRLEQREGRVDRFGQTRAEVQSCLLYGADNPMDQVVLKVLYRKARTIRDKIGVSIPFPEDSRVFLDTIFKAVLAEAEKKRRPVEQMELFSLEEMVRSEEELDKLVSVTEKKEAALRSIFAQQSIKAQEIEEDLAVTDEAVGRPETVYRFVDSSLRELFGVEAEKSSDTLELQVHRSKFPEKLTPWLVAASGRGDARIAFRAPVNDGYTYWGRNHDAVEALCRTVLSESLNPSRENKSVARAAVVASRAVKERTAIYVLRARHVIRDAREKKLLVAEEALLQGVSGPARTPVPLDTIGALMDNPQPAADLPRETQAMHLERELSVMPDLQASFDALAFQRAQDLIGQHERYYRAVGTETRSGRLHVVEPVIPMDVLGLYVFLPVNT